MVQVFVNQLFSVLWVESAQNDGDVKVHHQQEGQENETGEEDEAQHRAAAVAYSRRSWVLCEGVAIWRCVHDGMQQTRPSRRWAHHKHTDQAAPKGLKVKHVVDHGLLLHMAKAEHASDGEDEDDGEEDETDVEEGRKWLHKCQKQRPDASGEAK